MYASVIFIQTMFTDRMTSDDCLWVEEVNGKKLEDALLITQILPGGNTDDAGIKDGDILIELGGQKFKSSLEAQKILNSFDAGELIKYKVIRGSEVIETEVKSIKVFNALFLIFSLLGFGFLFIGHIVGYSKPKELTSQLFFFLGCAAVCGFVNVGQMNIPLMSNPILIVSTIGMILFFPLFLHFFLSYPTKREFRYRKLLLGIAYTLPIILVVSIRLINASEIKFIRVNSIPNVISISYVVTGIAFFLGFLCKN